MNFRQKCSLLCVLVAAITTLLASSLTEDGLSSPPVAVNVSYVLNNAANGLGRELDTYTALLTQLQLSGSYAANQGAKLTLDRSIINFDSGSSFSLTLTPGSDETVQGAAEIEISALLDFGLTRNPNAGQFSSLMDGTSTLVTVATGGVNTAIAGGNSVFYSWSAFAALADDTTASLDIRAAAIAYDMLEVVVRSALIGLDVVDNIENNKTALEGANLNSPIELSCALDSASMMGQSRLIWTSDATGTGQGQVGRGDAFESRFGNCRNSVRNYFLDGDVILSDYLPATGAGLHTLGYDIDLRSLLVAESEIDIDTRPSATSPRYDGALSLMLTEIAIPPPTN